MKKQLSSDNMKKSIFLLQPSRPILCTTKNEDGSDHIAPFSWCTPVSMDPPMISLSLLHHPKKSHSLGNIERTGEFVLNLPDMSLTDEIVKASYWTMHGENKFERSGLTRMPSKAVSPVAVKECRSHLECRVVSITTPGDHSIILANVLAGIYDHDAFNDHMMIDTSRFRPVMHLHNYVMDHIGSQIHFFVNPQGAIVTEVLYPSKYDDDEAVCGGDSEQK